jgi:hypothetical protein
MHDGATAHAHGVLGEAGLHAATYAWLHAGGTGIPRAIERIGEAGERKSSVYRLHGLRPDNRPVVAKHMRRRTAEVEIVVYEEILNGTTLPALELFAFMHESETRSWLFLEDAGDQRYRRSDPGHRRLAANYLATLHTELIGRPHAANLPACGAARYLELLERAKRSFEEAVRSGVAGERHIEQIRPSVDLLDQVTSVWDEIEPLCEGLPCSLVHGDFIPKNLRIRQTNSSPELVAFDWEAAGWGLPAEDLAEVDPDLYLSSMIAKGHDLVAQQVTLLANLGALFQSIAWMQSIAGQLGPDWADGACRQLREASLNLVTAAQRLTLRSFGSC